MERKTRQREAICKVIEEAKEALLPQEIWTRAREWVPNLGIATVYRTIQELMEAGAVVPVCLPGDPARYEKRLDTHHHHFKCVSCGVVVPVWACFSEFNRLAPSGFHVTDHDLVLYGECNRCAHEGPAR